jgi:hypothetical protein
MMMMLISLPSASFTEFFSLLMNGLSSFSFLITRSDDDEDFVVDEEVCLQIWKMGNEKKGLSFFIKSSSLKTTQRKAIQKRSIRQWCNFSRFLIWDLFSFDHHKKLKLTRFSTETRKERREFIKRRQI